MSGQMADGRRRMADVSRRVSRVARRALTVAAGGAAPAAPAPAKTGNAGLLGSTGTSMALVLVLGVFALTLVAGARTATRKS